MKHRLDCRIVQDLLPSYVDGITCEYTNGEIEAHISECSECSEVLRRMQEPEVHGESEEVEIAYMKKIQNRMSRWKAFGSALAVILALVVILEVVLYSRMVPKSFEEVFNVNTDNISCVSIHELANDMRIELKEDELDEFLDLMEDADYFYEGQSEGTMYGRNYLIFFYGNTGLDMLQFYMTDELYVYYSDKTYSIRNDEAVMEWVAKKVVEGDTYEYPNPESYENWAELSIEELRELCRVPEDILKNMSDEQLIQAILDYPFVPDVFAFSTMEAGIKALEETCDAYAELLGRESGLESLLKYIEKRVADFDENPTGEKEFYNEILARIILHQEKYKEILTDENKKLIEALSNMTMDVE